MSQALHQFLDDLHANLKKKIEEPAPVIQKGLFPGELPGETDESDAINEPTLKDNDGTAKK